MLKRIALALTSIHRQLWLSNMHHLVLVMEKDELLHSRSMEKVKSEE